ncbi:MAG: major capsid protein V20 domain-containing protein, partial [Candidatus Fonsibacter sp.]
ISCCGKYDGVTPAVQRSGFSGVGANLANTNAPNPGVQYVPTTGTILVLKSGEVIQLTEEYYAPGSLVTFNLQLTVQVQNDQI